MILIPYGTKPLTIFAYGIHLIRGTMLENDPPSAEDED